MDSDTQRTIGYVYWDGSNITSIQSYFGNIVGFPEASYDSGWFAVTTGTVYTKTHGLGAVPKAYSLFHSTNSTGSVENVVVITVKPNAVNYYYGNVGFDSANAYIETSTDAERRGACQCPALIRHRVLQVAGVVLIFSREAVLEEKSTLLLTVL